MIISADRGAHHGTPVFKQKQLICAFGLIKLEVGKYHLVRLIRSDLKLDIFGERFPVPPETIREYVVATIDVKEQKLKLFLDKTQVEEFDYKLP